MSDPSSKVSDPTTPPVESSDEGDLVDSGEGGPGEESTEAKPKSGTLQRRHSNATLTHKVIEAETCYESLEDLSKQMLFLFSKGGSMCIRLVMINAKQDIQW